MKIEVVTKRCSCPLDLFYEGVFCMTSICPSLCISFTNESLLLYFEAILSFIFYILFSSLLDVIAVIINLESYMTTHDGIYLFCAIDVVH